MEKTASQQLWIGMIPETPVGSVWVGVTEDGLSALEIGGSNQEFVQALSARYGENITKNESKTSVVIAQITEYLNGTRRHFDIPIDWSVLTAFQEKTLRTVYAIPYGATRSYGQIAALIGAQNAQRAVGRANATNPIPLVVPCHRVIGADGSLRGYGSGDGIRTKAWLLELEKLHAD
jgi:methylated-DNA-[protein]-cysteine S-methyltransferase